MIDYLDRVEAELRRAAYHQPRRRRLPGAVPAVAIAVAALLAVVVITTNSDDARERPATASGAVDISVEENVMMTVGASPRRVSLQVTAGEPSRVLMTVTAAGEQLASTTEEVGPGPHWIAVATPPDVTGLANVTLIVTDDDGNQATFERDTVLHQTQPIESFQVLRNAYNIVPEPAAFPTPFLRAEFGDRAEYHEAFSDPQVGQVWAIRTDSKICTLFYGATDAVMHGCVEPSQAWAEGHCCPIVDAGDRGITAGGRGILALVPDGTTDAEVTYADGGVEEIEIRGNVLVAIGEVDEVRWTAPDGTHQTFPLP